jgi:hypothetical protein
MAESSVSRLRIRGERSVRSLFLLEVRVGANAETEDGKIGAVKAAQVTPVAIVLIH